MLTEEFLNNSRARFAIVGPSTSESEITAIFSHPFAGREDLIQFYRHQNGGCRTQQGCLIHCGNPAHRVSRDNLDELRIEGFFSISRNAEDKMLPFAPMLAQYATTQEIYGEIPDMKEFLETHKPIAFDHSGNELWIDTDQGHIHFMNWDEYERGAVDIASSFSNFVHKFWINGPTSDLE
jgi:hypothetical protein